jgi:hypothetical protein
MYLKKYISWAVPNTSSPGVLVKRSVENDPTGVDLDARRIAKKVDVDVDIANLT